MIKMKLEGYMQKSHCQPLSFKFQKMNIGRVFVDLIMHGWLTPLNNFFSSAPALKSVISHAENKFLNYQPHH